MVLITPRLWVRSPYEPIKFFWYLTPIDTETEALNKWSVPGLVGAADPAALFRDDESEMHPQPAVCGSGVRPHVSSRLHHGELNLQEKAAHTQHVKRGKHKKIKTHTGHISTAPFKEVTQ